jgi:hypothetical protein
VSFLVFVSCWAALTLLAAVLLRGARDGFLLAALLALFQSVFYGLPVAAVVYYVLRRRRGRTRARLRTSATTMPCCPESLRSEDVYLAGLTKWGISSVLLTP